MVYDKCLIIHPLCGMRIREKVYAVEIYLPYSQEVVNQQSKLWIQK